LSELILNGTSAHLGYIVPFTLYVLEKIYTIHIYTIR